MSVHFFSKPTNIFATGLQHPLDTYQKHGEVQRIDILLTEQDLMD